MAAAEVVVVATAVGGFPSILLTSTIFEDTQRKSSWNTPGPAESEDVERQIRQVLSLLSVKSVKAGGYAMH